MSAVLSFRGVSRSFGRVEALREVTLEIPEGSVYGLVGRNGAGKSTLLRMVPALLHPSSGTVRVFDQDPWTEESVRAEMGYLSDSDVHPPFLRVRELMEFYASVYPRWDDVLAKRLLEQFAIDPTKRLGFLSKGQKRQAGLISVVCHRPRLLILDEPAGGLDPVARRELLEVVLDLLAREGTTVVFSSHQLADVERLATRIGILHHGRLIADQPVDELKESACRVDLRAAGIAREDLVRLLPALRVASDDGRHRLTLLCRPEAATDLLRSRLPGSAVLEIQDVQALNLEELFFDWTGDAP